MAWMGRRDIKLAVYPGLYGFSLYHLVFNKHLLYFQECLALLKGIQPKIKNPEVQKALSEVEAEISKGL